MKKSLFGFASTDEIRQHSVAFGMPDDALQRRDQFADSYGSSRSARRRRQIGYECLCGFGIP